ncbi:MAG: prepilin-type N-terminal cleavage/methylation domain-containing protein [Kiritimatiellae bacterium]|nr:prepilin-type N-terminal cleavage/methylation domain-containing protein [Kiritimatiellia bacterium]
MKNFRKSSAAFTLVEMLVVIVIISVVALAMARAVRGARRQANATKCQANMKNLHTAVVSYASDKGYYPLASSYETLDKNYNSKGETVLAYHEKRGWVSWLPKNGLRRDENRKTVWDKVADKSHADDFYYPGNTDERMSEAIREGALFKYTGKDLATYRCPEHPDYQGKSVHLAFAMNTWFGSHCQGREEVDGKKKNPGKRFADIVRGRSPAAVADKDSSRMALFVEIDEAGPSTEGETPSKNDRSGQSADEKTKIRVFADDCVWQWDHETAQKRELGRFTHRKTNKNYSHVVFLDGHVTSICENFDTFRNDSEAAKDAKNMTDVFTVLGDGTF